jgi:hypothetical protein
MKSTKKKRINFSKAKSWSKGASFTYSSYDNAVSNSWKRSCFIPTCFKMKDICSNYWLRHLNKKF